MTAQLTLTDKALPRLLSLSGSQTDFILSSVDGKLSIRVGLSVATVPSAEVALGVGDVAVNWALGTVRRGPTSVALTRMELRLLALLSERAGEVVEHAELKAALWPHAAPARRDADMRLAVLVCALRKRLRVLGADHAVRTVRATGYALHR